MPPRPGRPDGLILLCDGGVLNATEIAVIRLPAAELADWAFADTVWRHFRTEESRVEPPLAESARWLVASLRRWPFEFSSERAVGPKVSGLLR